MGNDLVEVHMQHVSKPIDNIDHVTLM